MREVVQRDQELTTGHTDKKVIGELWLHDFKAYEFLLQNDFEVRHRPLILYADK